MGFTLSYTEEKILHIIRNLGQVTTGQLKLIMGISVIKLEHLCTELYRNNYIYAENRYLFSCPEQKADRNKEDALWIVLSSLDKEVDRIEFFMNNIVNGNKRYDYAYCKNECLYFVINVRNNNLEELHKLVMLNEYLYNNDYTKEAGQAKTAKIIVVNQQKTQLTVIPSSNYSVLVTEIRYETGHHNKMPSIKLRKGD